MLHVLTTHTQKNRVGGNFWRCVYGIGMVMASQEYIYLQIHQVVYIK